MKTSQPDVRLLEERTVAYVSFVGNYIGKSEIFHDLFTKLGAWAGPKGLIGPTTQFLSSYKDDPNVTQPEDLTLEVCLTIPEETEVEGEIKKQALPGGQYVVMNAELTGSDEYAQAWIDIVKWIDKSEYEIDMSRPSYEVYLNNPEEHPEKHHIIDICMSVKSG